MDKNISKSIKEKVGLKGVYVITRANLEKPEHFALDQKIKDLRSKSMPFLHLVRQLNDMCRVDKFVFENLVPTVGRTLIANNLTDATPDNTMLITHAALGSGGTAPANGNTTLETEVYRNAIASLANANNVGHAAAFYNASETSGTYAEAGIFCNGTGSADSGILLSRVLISVTKSTEQTLTIDWTLTIS